jgi:hypothetical protein
MRKKLCDYCALREKTYLVYEKPHLDEYFYCVKCLDKQNTIDLVMSVASAICSDGQSVLYFNSAFDFIEDFYDV